MSRNGSGVSDTISTPCNNFASESPKSEKDLGHARIMVCSNVLREILSKGV